MRRAEGGAASWRDLLVGIVLPGAGFGLAHFLHLLQMAGELGGLSPAIAEITRTAAGRAAAADGKHFDYLRTLLQSTYLYIREFLRLYNQHFGPFLPLAILLAAAAAVFRQTSLTLWPYRQPGQLAFHLAWPGPKKLWPALLAAFIVCVLWPVAMPGANIGNFHVYPRNFFFLYFILVVGVVRSLSFRRAPDLEAAR
jgi:hypothetical protein